MGEFQPILMLCEAIRQRTWDWGGGEGEGVCASGELSLQLFRFFLLRDHPLQTPDGKLRKAEPSHRFSGLPCSSQGVCYKVHCSQGDLGGGGARSIREWNPGEFST